MNKGDSGLAAPGQIKQVSVEAVVIRADGTREDLGAVSFWSSNPLKMLVWNVRQFWKELKNESQLSRILGREDKSPD